MPKHATAHKQTRCSTFEITKMRGLLLILFLSLCKITLADGSDIYVLKIKICTVENKEIIGFIKINDYVIDKYLDKTKPETLKDLLIENVQYTRTFGEFSYFESSIDFLYKPMPNSDIGYNIYQLQIEKNIPNIKIKAISIIGKNKEERSLSIITELKSDNQFWFSKEPIKIIDIGGSDDYCFYNAILYSTNAQIENKISEKRWNEDLNDFIFEQIKKGEQIVIVQTCTE